MREEQIDLVFKALAHPERRRILAALRSRPDQSLFEICVASMENNEQPLSRQTISQHLEMLERAGLVVTSWKGRTKAHSLDLDPLRRAVETSIDHYL
ncbi:MAG: helix-turn-helix domain-containing protein [Usitatibacteraceae bacterium]